MSKILVIEDHSQMRENLALMLEMEGFAVFRAENGHRGIELARSRAPDLILCDVMMPEADGYETLSALRADKRKRSSKASPIATSATFLSARNAESVS